MIFRFIYIGPKTTSHCESLCGNLDLDSQPNSYSLYDDKESFNPFMVIDCGKLFNGICNCVNIFLPNPKYWQSKQNADVRGMVRVSPFFWRSSVRI